MMNTLVWKDVFYAGTLGGGLGLLTDCQLADSGCVCRVMSAENVECESVCVTAAKVSSAAAPIAVQGVALLLCVAQHVAAHWGWET